MRFLKTCLTTLLVATSSILAFDVDVRQELRIQQDAQQLTDEMLVITEYDLKPSMEWATVQIESLVPTELVAPNTTTPVAAPRPLIRNALAQLSKIVIKELQPGLKNAIVQLIKTHANNPELADQLITREELMVFVNQVSQSWSDTIETAVRKWSQEHLDGLISVVGRILVGVGKEVFKRLGQLGGFLLHHGRRNQCVYFFKLTFHFD
jgi:hypothetical protein